MFRYKRRTPGDLQALAQRAAASPHPPRAHPIPFILGKHDP